MAKLLSGTRIYGNATVDGNLTVGSNASSLLSSSMNGISLQGQLQPYTLQGSDGTVTSAVLTLPSTFAIAALASTGNIARSYISKSSGTNDLQIGSQYTGYQGNVVLNAGTGATAGIRIITGTTANFVSTFDNAGNLTVAGNTTVSGGQLTVGNIVATGNVSIAGNLSITGTYGNITGANVISSNTVITSGNVTALGFVGTQYGNVTGMTGGNVYVTGTVLPTANISYDLGSPTLRWRSIYISANTIDIGGATIGANVSMGTLTITGPGGASFTLSGTSNQNSTGAFGYLQAGSNSAATSVTTGALQVTGGAGITGNLYVAGNIVTTGTGYITIPVGTTAQRPGTAASGMIRYNTSLSSFEGYGSAWSSLGGVKSVDGNTYILAEATVGAGDNTLWFYNNATNTAKLTTSNLTLLQTTTSTSSTTGALIVTGGIGVAKDSFFGANVTITGNLTVSGNSVSIGASTLSIQDPIISLNTPGDLTPLTTATTSDIGIKFHYYDTSDQHAFLGRAVDTGYLEWYSRGNDTANVFTGTVYGTVKTGAMFLANTGTALTVSDTIVAKTVNAGTIGNSGATLTGTLSTAAQPNITSVGTLTSLAVGTSLTVDNGSYGNVVATQFGSVFATAYGSNNYSILQAWSPATGGALGLNAYGNIIYSSGAITFKTGAAVRDKDYPTGGTTGVQIAANGAVIASTGIASTTTGTGAVIVSGGVGISGALNVGANVTVTGNVLPSANVTYSLGSATQRWKDLWLSGSTIDLSGATIKTDATTGAVAIIPNPTATNPNPSGIVISPAGTVSTVTTTAGVPTAGAISNVSNVATTSSTSTFANANVTSNTASTSTTTGALIVAGGTGIASDAYIGGNVNIVNRSFAKFIPSGSSNWVGLRAPSSVSANITFNLPGADGTAGQFLKTDGAGNWSFATASGGGGGSSGFSVSTITTHPAAAGNKSLGTGTDNVTEETPFASGGTDAFGVSLGIVYDQMEPTGTTVTVDMGSEVSI